MTEILIEYDEDIEPFPIAQETVFINCIKDVVHHLVGTDKVINLLFCTTHTIQSLNKSYRDKDKPTDVLSWAYDEVTTGEDDFIMPDEEQVWGDLALCVDVCEKQAHQSGWDINTEIIRLLVHGLTHLAGYDHQTPSQEKEMLRIEMELLSKIGFDDIYNQEN